MVKVRHICVTFLLQATALSECAKLILTHPNPNTFPPFPQLRFTRMGRKRTPFYRLIAIDSKKRRDGLPLEVYPCFDYTYISHTVRSL